MRIGKLLLSLLLLIMLIQGYYKYRASENILNENAIQCKSRSEYIFQTYDDYLFYRIIDGKCCTFGIDDNGNIKKTC